MIESITVTKRTPDKICYLVGNNVNGDTVLVSIAVERNPIFGNQSDDIVQEEFDKNGDNYKIVKMSSGKYTYRDARGFLLPYRFDLASEFNEFRMAMVAINGQVTWVRPSDSGLEYYCQEGKFVPLSPSNRHQEIRGFNFVEQFSEGHYPLSRLGIGSGCAEYLRPTGEIAQFSPYLTDDLKWETQFFNGTRFIEGIAYFWKPNDNEAIGTLFSHGVLIKPNTLIEI
jgi:hypothetical protein